MTRTLDLTITKGDTFSHVEQRALEIAPFIYKPITAITKAGPVAITSAAHGFAAGWRVAVWGVGGMRQLNALQFPPRSSDFHPATITSSSIVSLNDVDSELYTTYTSGGNLVAYTPLSLAGCTARMQIRETAESTTTLASLVSPTDIALDDTAHTVTITISATATAAYTFTQGVYDLEVVVTATGVVTKILSGNVYVLSEVTR